MIVWGGGGEAECVTRGRSRSHILTRNHRQAGLGWAGLGLAGRPTSWGMALSQSLPPHPARLVPALHLRSPLSSPSAHLLLAPPWGEPQCQSLAGRPMPQRWGLCPPGSLQPRLKTPKLPGGRRRMAEDSGLSIKSGACCGFLHGGGSTSSPTLRN